MQSQTKLGLLLLIPPVFLWILVLTALFDQPIAYIFIERIDPPLLDTLYFVSGMIFPAAGFVVGVNNLWKKQEAKYNIWIVIISILFFVSTILAAFGI